MTAPDFIQTSYAEILAAAVADYEARTGRTLLPSQTEQLLLNSVADAVWRQALGIQSAATAQLAEFATGPALDQLVSLLAVSRLPASSATVIIRYTLAAGHPGVVIPAGQRVGTSDGLAAFATSVEAVAPTGAATIDVQAFALTSGASANGYQPSTVNVILDPQPFVVSATNPAATNGGADAESDEALRARARNAPASFSVAGPRNAYKFFAQSASPAIIDVAVQQITPGTVGVWPLVADGATSGAVLDLVRAALDPDTVIPETDTVVVAAPTLVPYDLEVDIELLEGANAGEATQQITANLAAYGAAKRARLGQDIVLAQVVAACMVAGVYSAAVVDPAATIVIDHDEVAVLGDIILNITGTTEP